MVHDSPLLVQQIRDLKMALKNVQNEKLQLQTKLYKTQLDSLQPLNVSKNKMLEEQEENSFDKLENKACSLQKKDCHLKMEAADSLETLVLYYQTTWHLFLKDCGLIVLAGKYFT